MKKILITILVIVILIAGWWVWNEQVGDREISEKEAIEIANQVTEVKEFLGLYPDATVSAYFGAPLETGIEPRWTISYTTSLDSDIYCNIMLDRYGNITQINPHFEASVDETADCLEKYPLVTFEDCVPGRELDGWQGVILYPNSLDTSSIEHYIDAPAPDTVKQAGIASYGSSWSTCQTTWSIKVDGEWRVVSQIEFCNHIIDYNSSCDGCLLEWEEGCC